MFSLGVGWGSGFGVASSGSCHALIYSASDCACELCVCVCVRGWGARLGVVRFRVRFVWGVACILGLRGPRVS